MQCYSVVKQIIFTQLGSSTLWWTSAVFSTSMSVSGMWWACVLLSDFNRHTKSQFLFLNQHAQVLLRKMIWWKALFILSEMDPSSPQIKLWELVKQGVYTQPFNVNTAELMNSSEFSRKQDTVHGGNTSLIHVLILTDKTHTTNIQVSLFVQQTNINRENIRQVQMIWGVCVKQPGRWGCPSRNPLTQNRKQQSGHLFQDIAELCGGEKQMKSETTS